MQLGSGEVLNDDNEEMLESSDVTRNPTKQSGCDVFTIEASEPRKLILSSGNTSFDSVKLILGILQFIILLFYVEIIVHTSL